MEPAGGCGRQDLRFMLQELVQKAKAGRDHMPPLLNVIECLLHGELLGLQEVSHANGGQMEDPSFTVGQDRAYCCLKVEANVSLGDPLVVWMGLAGLRGPG